MTIESQNKFSFGVICGGFKLTLKHMLELIPSINFIQIHGIEVFVTIERPASFSVGIKALFQFSTGGASSSCTGIK